MTEIEILRKVIDKAIENGYKPPFKEYWRHRSKIFSHDFAKAFWGEGKTSGCGVKFEWQAQLQIMVLEENPINYLKHFI